MNSLLIRKISLWSWIALIGVAGGACPAWTQQPSDALPGCIPALKSVLRSAGQSTLEARRANHILDLPGGKCAVLLPVSDGSLKVVEVAGPAEARVLATSIVNPLDLQALINGRMHELEDLMGAVKTRLGSREDIGVTARVKDPESLKAKLFDKAKKRKFTLGDIDDIVGARVVVPSLGELDTIANRLTGLQGFHLVKFEPIKYERGYRAIHLTLADAKGAPVEVQVMTQRMSEWVSWDARRVYKTKLDRSSPYFKHLQDYDRQLVDYINALDEGRPLPARPDPAALGIAPDDVFDDALLRH